MFVHFLESSIIPLTAGKFTSRVLYRVAPPGKAWQIFSPASSRPICSQVSKAATDHAAATKQARPKRHSSVIHKPVPSKCLSLRHVSLEWPGTFPCSKTSLSSLELLLLQYAAYFKGRPHSLKQIVTVHLPKVLHGSGLRSSLFA